MLCLPSLVFAPQGSVAGALDRSEAALSSLPAGACGDVGADLAGLVSSVSILTVGAGGMYVTISAASPTRHVLVFTCWFGAPPLAYCTPLIPRACQGVCVPGRVHVRAKASGAGLRLGVTHSLTRSPAHKRVPWCVHRLPPTPGGAGGQLQCADLNAPLEGLLSTFCGEASIKKER